MRASQKASVKEPATPVKPHAVRAGDVVMATGIYEIIHGGQHRPTHEVILIRDERFPSCEGCGAALRIRLLRAAPYIFHDKDFAPST
jgi:hypothetical protein